MIPTSNELTYKDLLVKYQPKPIKTRQEYEQALGIIEGMMSRNLTKDEGILFELLLLLIETYEEKHYPINKSTPKATLESLIHEFEIDYKDLLDIFGDLNTVEQVIIGKQDINHSQAESLANFFNLINPQLALIAHDFLPVL
jgi:HTH-type transcriptional regulator/antitoxin HigA